MAKLSSSNGKKANVPKLRFPEFTEEWKASNIGEISTYIKGAPLSKSDISETGTPFILYGELYTTYKEVASEIKRKTNCIVDKKYFSKIGDVVIPTSGETPEEIATATCVMTPNVILAGDLNIFRINDIDGRFFSYVINHKVNKDISRIAQGKSIVHIKGEEISKIQIKYPSAEEQQKILSFIELLSLKIEKQERLIEKLKKYKRGLLQQIFNTNLKYCNSNKCKEKSICDVFSITRGYVLPISKISPVKTSEFCYPVYSSQTIDDGLLGYYNEYLFENAITWTTDGANAGYTRFRKGKFYCTNVCGVLLNNNGFANEYVAEKINSVSRKYVSYVGNPKLMNNVMAEITIPFPDVETQKYYSEIIDKINMKLSISYNQCNTLELLKRCLLQQMFI